MLRIGVLGGATLGESGVDALTRVPGTAVRHEDPEVPGEGSDVTVVDLPFAERARSFEVSALLRGHGRRAVFVVPAGPEVCLVAQAAVAGAPCYCCFELRRMALEADPLALLATSHVVDEPPSLPSGAVATLAEHVGRIAAGDSWAAAGVWTRVTVVASSGAAREEWLAKHPRCPLGPAGCSDPSGEPPAAAVVSGVCGLVGTPVVDRCASAYVAEAPVSNPNLAVAPGRLRAHGCSDGAAQAELAAVGEALELYSCNVWEPARGDMDDEPREDAVATARFFGLAGDAGIEARYWVWMTSLTTGGAAHVPVEVVSPRLRTAAWQTLASTNGMAAHTARDEAVSNAVAEVVERDAFLVTWRASLNVERLRIETHPRPQVRRLVDDARSLSLELRAYALPAAVAGSAVLAFALAPPSGSRVARLAVGLGCHRDEAAAARKALFEAVLAWRELTRRIESLTPESERAMGAAQASAVPAQDAVTYALSGDLEPFEFILESGEAREVGGSGDPRPAETEWWVSAVADGGYEVLCADVTPPEVAAAGWHVVRAAIPDLLPMTHGDPISFERSPRLGRALGSSGNGSGLNPLPHPFA